MAGKILPKKSDAIKLNVTSRVEIRYIYIYIYILTDGTIEDCVISKSLEVRKVVNPDTEIGHVNLFSLLYLLVEVTVGR